MTTGASTWCFSRNFISFDSTVSTVINRTARIFSLVWKSSALIACTTISTLHSASFSFEGVFGTDSCEILAFLTGVGYLPSSCAFVFLFWPQLLSSESAHNPHRHNTRGWEEERTWLLLSATVIIEKDGAQKKLHNIYRPLIIGDLTSANPQWFDARRQEYSERSSAGHPDHHRRRKLRPDRLVQLDS